MNNSFELPPVELGSFHENLAAFEIAVHLMKTNHGSHGLQLLRQLRDHIERTSEIKSVVHLLTPVRALLSQHERRDVERASSMQPYCGTKAMGIIASPPRATKGLQISVASLLTECPDRLFARPLVIDEVTYAQMKKIQSPVINDSSANITVVGAATSGGLVQMAGMVADGNIDSLIVYPGDGDDFGNFEWWTLIRAAIQNNVNVVPTFRGICAFLQASGRMANPSFAPLPENEAFAIVAHPAFKLEAMLFAVRNAALIARFSEVFATGTTGNWLKLFLEAIGQDVTRIRILESGPRGGDEQLARLITDNHCHHVVFLIDTQWGAPHQAAVSSLVKACIKSNTTLALNLRSANEWLMQLPVPA